jgi:hypothetical protein
MGSSSLIASVRAGDGGRVGARGRGPAAPRGVLLAVIGADPPSLDPHQESTFANIELVAPLYSTLLQLDPYHYTSIVGGRRHGMEDRGRWTDLHFKIARGFNFHDGSTLTAWGRGRRLYDKIIAPPPGSAHHR